LGEKSGVVKNHNTRENFSNKDMFLVLGNSQGGG